MPHAQMTIEREKKYARGERTAEVSRGYDGDGARKQVLAVDR